MSYIFVINLGHTYEVSFTHGLFQNKAIHLKYIYLLIFEQFVVFRMCKRFDFYKSVCMCAVFVGVCIVLCYSLRIITAVDIF